MSTLRDPGFAERMEDWISIPLAEMVVDPGVALERLTELRRVLDEELPADADLEMTCWCDASTTPGECGTSACALGWGVILSPVLRGAGLHLVPCSEGGGLHWMPATTSPNDNIVSFFGLTWHGADFLFYFEGYGEAARQEAIRRINALLTVAREALR